MQSKVTVIRIESLAQIRASVNIVVLGFTSDFRLWEKTTRCHNCLVDKNELDQALDLTYRAAVTAVIQKQAGSELETQFVCSTFRPDLVAVADGCYGIRHQDEVSWKEKIINFKRGFFLSHVLWFLLVSIILYTQVCNVHVMSKRDALKFIANLMSEGEAVGEVSYLCI